jgi:hypothetical protein
MGAVLSGAALFGASIGGVVSTDGQLRAATPAAATARYVVDHGRPGDCPSRDRPIAAEERL